MTPSVAKGVAAALDLVAAARRAGDRRVIVGIAGPPASGKSTLAAALVEALGAEAESGAALLPMDGFHLDNGVLEERGLLARKGAPETFDAAGFVAALARLRAADEDVVHPIFDRARDIAIAGAGVIPSAARMVVVEGNYLLLEEAPWSTARAVFDATLFLDPPLAEIERRLIERWLSYGHDRASATRRARGSDLANARLVRERSAPATARLGDAVDDAASSRAGDGG